MNIKHPFSVLTTPVPEFPTATVIEAVSEHYGRRGTLRPLASERDQNFHLITDDGPQFVLKISNSAEHPGVTDFQNKALLHIEQSDPGFPVPRVTRTVRGELAQRLTAADGRIHTFRLLTWLEGTPLQYLDRADSVPWTLGICLSRLDKALQGFSHQSSDYRLLWDVKQASHLRELLQHIEDVPLRHTCHSLLDHFETALQPELKNLRWQVIYNDLNPSNVLVDSKSPETVAGVIDFGDLVRSPLIQDVAVAAAYLCIDGEDPLADVKTFVAAYTSQHELRSLEFELLYDLILMRKVLTILITNWRVARYPENRDYIMRNQTHARQTLERLMQQDAHKMTETLRQACDSQHGSQP